MKINQIFSRKDSSFRRRANKAVSSAIADVIAKPGKKEEEEEEEELGVCSCFRRKKKEGGKDKGEEKVRREETEEATSNTTFPTAAKGEQSRGQHDEEGFLFQLYLISCRICGSILNLGSQCLLSSSGCSLLILVMAAKPST